MGIGALGSGLRGLQGEARVVLAVAKHEVGREVKTFGAVYHCLIG